LPNLVATVDLVYKANGTFDRGTSMTNRITNPKALLRGQDLIGFARNTGNGDQIPRRASSAKVTSVEPDCRAAETVAVGQPTRKE
jgi:hypothetical protein